MAPPIWPIISKHENDGKIENNLRKRASKHVFGYVFDRNFVKYQPKKRTPDVDVRSDGAHHDHGEQHEEDPEDGLLAMRLIDQNF